VATFRHLAAPEDRPRWRTWWHCILGSLSRHEGHLGWLGALPKQRKSMGYRRTHHKNNEKNKPRLATFDTKFCHLAVFHMAKVKKKKSHGRHSRAPPNSKNAAPNSTNVKTRAVKLCTTIARNHGNKIRKYDRQRHLRSIRGEAGPPFSNFEAP